MDLVNNNYYVYHFGGKTEGPYTIRQAMREKAHYDSLCDWCRVLKVVVDFTGEEVK